MQVNGNISTRILTCRLGTQYSCQVEKSWIKCWAVCLVLAILKIANQDGTGLRGGFLRSVLSSYMGDCVTMATLAHSPTGIICFHCRVLADTERNTYFTTRLAQDLANSIKVQAVYKSCPTRAEFANSAGGHSWDNCRHTVHQ
jgi:hypothetical protein